MVQSFSVNQNLSSVVEVSFFERVAHQLISNICYFLSLIILKPFIFWMIDVSRLNSKLLLWIDELFQLNELFNASKRRKHKQQPNRILLPKIIISLTTVEDQIRIISKRHLNNLHPFLPFWFKHQNLHDTCHLLFCHVSHTLSFSTLWIFTLIFQNYQIVFQTIPTQQECSKTPIFLIRKVTV